MGADKSDTSCSIVSVHSAFAHSDTFVPVQFVAPASAGPSAAAAVDCKPLGSAVVDTGATGFVEPSSADTGSPDKRRTADTDSARCWLDMGTVAR